MNLRIYVSIVVFIGSYLPLSLILLAQDFDYSYLGTDICVKFWEKNAQCVMPFRHFYASLAIFFTTLICFITTMFVLWIVPMNRSVNITSAEYVPSELMSYTLPYVVSFMGVGYSDGDKFVGMAIFLMWIFWITHKSGQVMLNPVLVVFGWRLHKITYRFDGDDREYRATALFKGDVSVSAFVKCNWIQDIMIVGKK